MLREIVSFNRLWAQCSVFLKVLVLQAHNVVSNYMANVPKLKERENYDWAFAAENFLIFNGMQKCIDGIETDVEKIAKTKAKLILILYTYKRNRTAAELWTKLKLFFDDSGFTRKISILRTLISTRLENCDSMASFVNQMIETA